MLPVSQREITMPFLILLIFLQLHFIHGLSLSEYNALLAIKSAITHDPHDFLSSWNSTAHHCNWPGVECCPSHNLDYNCSSTPNGAVVSLDIHAHNLTGSLSRDIGFLTYLRYLYAGNNKLSGPLPYSLSLLSAIQSIDLSGNNFNGAIPEFIGDLPELVDLWLSENNLSGSVPQKLGTNGKLDNLHLWGNQLTGKLPESLGGCQSLTTINAADNFLSGSIPKALFGLPKLQFLRLQDNRFSGSIPEAHDSVAPNLWYMGLSNNELSGRIPLSIGNFSALRLLYLDGNSFTGSIPPEIAHLQQLEEINLSRNNLTGQIPAQIQNSKMFRYLNLSRNQLSGCITEVPGFVDISYNVLQGALPVFPSNLQVFFASNNRFNGPIDPSICNSSASLSALDLSNNKLVGQIPSCLVSSFRRLRVLNLQHNNLSGSIPIKFFRCDSLMDLDLSYNQLEGNVPKSLAQCNNLEVVNLGSNRLSDTFPHWLSTLPELQALILRFNYFHGPLTVRSHSKDSFSKLRMFDLSNNHFSGTLPSKLIENMKAMMSVGEGEERSSQEYLHGSYFKYFLVSVTVKGLDLEIRILNTLTTIDVSCNMFQGDIPTSIGDLKALRWLNLSHNNFTNKIPSTIGSLKVLESLDLSCNNLRGEIPREIEKLTSLEVFNVSQNQLVGPIPRSTQLSTFNNDSYLQNPGLCGSPLSKDCTNEDAPQHLPPISVNPPDTEWGSNIHLWEVIVMGCAVGWAVGVISGYFMLSSREPLWLSRWAYQLEYRVLHRSNEGRKELKKQMR